MGRVLHLTWPGLLLPLRVGACEAVPTVLDTVLRSTRDVVGCGYSYSRHRDSEEEREVSEGWEMQWGSR